MPQLDHAFHRTDVTVIDASGTLTAIHLTDEEGNRAHNSSSARGGRAKVDAEHNMAAIAAWQVEAHARQVERGGVAGAGPNEGLNGVCPGNGIEHGVIGADSCDWHTVSSAPATADSSVVALQRVMPGSGGGCSWLVTGGLTLYASLLHTHTRSKFCRF